MLHKVINYIIYSAADSIRLFSRDAIDFNLYNGGDLNTDVHYFETLFKDIYITGNRDNNS